MTPQERRLVDALFDKLSSLESEPRDAEAVQAISEGLQRAPNALYPLVQTALVQDEALRRADARIRELEKELGAGPHDEGQSAGFLDGMRDTLFGGSERQGSVPTVRPGTVASPSGAWGTEPRPGGFAQPQSGDFPQRQGGGSPAGSFLGTAAAAAAGAIGGTLLMNSMRGLFGGQQSAQGAQDSSSAATPWGAGAGGGSLAREAGLEDIGGGGRTAALDGSAHGAGQFDLASSDAGDADIDDDFDIGGDFDTA